MVADKTFFDQVVNVTHGYLGPAANRFVTRQVRNHLDKSPEQFRRQDMDELIDWFTTAMALLSEDPEIVHQYNAELLSLAKSK